MAYYMDEKVFWRAEKFLGNCAEEYMRTRRMYCRAFSFACGCGNLLFIYKKGVVQLR